MKIIPLFDRILAKPIKEKTTKSGLSLGLNLETTRKAQVIKVGKGIYEDGHFQEMEITENSIIYYEDHLVSKITIDNEEYLIIKQTDILAYEEGEN